MEKIKDTFWKKKKVLITGHSGFKGSWLVKILSILNAEIYGVSLKTKNNKSFFSLINVEKLVKKNFYFDIKNKTKLKKTILKISPDIIFHMAAQSLVIESYRKPSNTIETNLIGTMNILDAARECKAVKSIIIVTSDKCYENDDKNISFNESHKLGGDDPYSASKAMQEIVSNSYRKSFFKNKIIATVRAGNVIGGGDTSANRILPDIFLSVKKNKNILVRNPKFKRPWQHVLEPLYGYMELAKKIYQKKKLCTAFNFGPNSKNNINVITLVKKIKKYSKLTNKIKILKSSKKFNEKETIYLNCNKAKKKLGYKSILNIDETIKLTCNWYMSSINKKKNIIKLTEDQIFYYLKKCHY